jgi:hypothetical protein
MRYTATVHREDGNIVTEARDIDWRDLSSYVATWSRQMVQHVRVGEDVWDNTYYIQIHVND